MTFDVIMTIYIILSGIVVHIMWKRIENLEDWVMHLLEQTDCLIVDARFKAHCLNCAESGSHKCKKCDGEMYFKDTPQTEKTDRIPFDPMTEMTMKQMIEERLRQTERSE